MERNVELAKIKLEEFKEELAVLVRAGALLRKWGYIDIDSLIENLQWRIYALNNQGFKKKIEEYYDIKI